MSGPDVLALLRTNLTRPLHLCRNVRGTRSRIPYRSSHFPRWKGMEEVGHGHDLHRKPALRTVAPNLNACSHAVSQPSSSRPSVSELESGFTRATTLTRELLSCPSVSSTRSRPVSFSTLVSSSCESCPPYSLKVCELTVICALYSLYHDYMLGELSTSRASWKKVGAAFFCLFAGAICMSVLGVWA